MLDLERLKSLCAKSTPGKWEWVPHKFRDGYSGIENDKGIEVLYPDHCNESDYGAAWFYEYPSDADREILVEGHNAMPELISWIERAIPILQATETLAQVYCRFVCKDKNCKYCDYIQKDVPEANALLKEVSK